MEVLFVSHKFPPSTGGMERQSYDLITGMSHHCKVHQIVYNGQGNVLKFFFTLQRKIVRLCKEYPGISIIHYNDGLIAAFSLLHRKYPSLKRMATLHGLDVVFPDKIYLRYVFPRLNRFAKLIAVSDATAKQAAVRGIKEEKLVVINNGIDIGKSQQQADAADTWSSIGDIADNNKHILVMMGRPVIRKGFSWFIREVVPLLKGDFVLLIIGPFEPKPSVYEKSLMLLPAVLRKKIMLFFGYPSDQISLRKLLNTSAIKKQVKHLGRLPYHDIRTIFSKADAFLMPNIQVKGDMEGFGLVCLEAAAMGLPVFAADIDGIPDAIRHKQNGFLLAAGQPEVWARQLNEVISHPDEFKKYGPDFSRYTAEHFGCGNMVGAYYGEFLAV